MGGHTNTLDEYSCPDCGFPTPTREDPEASQPTYRPYCRACERFTK